MNSDRQRVDDESGYVTLLPESPAAGGRHWIDAFDGSRLADAPLAFIGKEPLRKRNTGRRLCGGQVAGE